MVHTLFPEPEDGCHPDAASKVFTSLWPTTVAQTQRQHAKTCQILAALRQEEHYFDAVFGIFCLVLLTVFTWKLAPCSVEVTEG